MNPVDRKRLPEAREKSVKEWIDKANAYIEVSSGGGVPTHDPEEIKRGLDESGRYLYRAIIGGYFGDLDSPNRLQAGHLLKKANESAFHLCCETGEILENEPLEQTNLDSLSPPPNWEKGHHYTFSDKVLKGGRIQMCVKEHYGSEELLGNPKYWRDVVTKNEYSGKVRKQQAAIDIYDLPRKVDATTNKCNWTNIERNVYTTNYIINNVNSNNVTNNFTNNVNSGNKMEELIKLIGALVISASALLAFGKMAFFIWLSWLW